MSAAVSIYIYDHTPSGQSRLYKQRKSSVHGTVSCVSKHTGVRCTTAVHYGPVFTPRLLPASVCKEFIVRYNIICCVSKHSYYYYLYCFCRLVFPLPTFVRTRNSLDVRCMENHVKTSMIIEKKVYVVHIKTSISTMEKTGMLYILKLVCLLQKHGKKRICCTY